VVLVPANYRFGARPCLVPGDEVPLLISSLIPLSEMEVIALAACG
jgi:hypothetical protein